MLNNILTDLFLIEDTEKVESDSKYLSSFLSVYVNHFFDSCKYAFYDTEEDIEELGFVFDDVRDRELLDLICSKINRTMYSTIYLLKDEDDKLYPFNHNYAKRLGYYLIERFIDFSYRLFPDISNEEERFQKTVEVIKTFDVLGCVGRYPSDFQIELLNQHSISIDNDLALKKNSEIAEILADIWLGHHGFEMNPPMVSLLYQDFFDLAITGISQNVKIRNQFPNQVKTFAFDIHNYSLNKSIISRITFLSKGVPNVVFRINLYELNNKSEYDMNNRWNDKRQSNEIIPSYCIYNSLLNRDCIQLATETECYDMVIKKIQNNEISLEDLHYKIALKIQSKYDVIYVHDNAIII